MFIFQVVSAAFHFAGKYQPTGLFGTQAQFCCGFGQFFVQQYFINRVTKVPDFQQLPVNNSIAKG